MSIYFATSGPYTKIGYSADPTQRVATVTTHGTRPADLPRAADATLLGWIPGNVAGERALHARFGNQWVAGEWFTLDIAEIRDLIWSDPRGVDIQRMSAMGVFAAMTHPDMTRDELAAAGVLIEAVPVDEVFATMSKRMSGAA